MAISEHDATAAEVAEAERLLQGIPAANWLTRASMEQRVRELRERLQELPKPRTRAAVALLFHGSPVCHRDGISADFAAKTMKEFQASIKALIAGLGASGKNAAKASEIMIVGTALGSFGFVVEEPPPETTDALSTLVGDAFDSFRELVRVSQGGDDELAATVEKVGVKAAQKVSRFFQEVAKASAGFVLRKDGEREVVSTPDVASSIAQRLGKRHITEETTALTGKLIAVLPYGHRFELLLDADPEHPDRDAPYVMRGAVEGQPEELEDLNAKAPIQVTAEIRQLRVGKVRPRYTMTSWDLVESDA